MDLGSLSNHSGHAARKSNQAIGLIYKEKQQLYMPVTLWVLFLVTSYLQHEGSLCNNGGQQHIKKVFSFSELECSLTRIQLQENFGPTFDNCLCSFSSFVKHFFYRKPNSCKK